MASVKSLGGTIKTVNGLKCVFFPGPSDAPQNSLAIPVKDFGYTKEKGIFRKSLRPNIKSEINLG
jgi:hypothetical protein